VLKINNGFGEAISCEAVSVRNSSCIHCQRIFAKYCRSQPDIFSLDKVEVARYSWNFRLNFFVSNWKDIDSLHKEYGKLCWLEEIVQKKSEGQNDERL